jgi:phosphopantothenoylcysteine decarboxylase/phosphopantothenate--cysteine ligase
VKILLMLSGSIACYKACDVISQLVKLGHEVQPVATPSALEFVGKATLEGLSGKPVFTDVFEDGKAMAHINLAKWADVAVVCPASANTINAMAAGLTSTAIGTLFLAWPLNEKPFMVAPAMNTRMWQHPATTAALETLQKWGVSIIAPGQGHLACGDVGVGRLAEPAEIVQSITSI